MFTEKKIEALDQEGYPYIRDAMRIGELPDLEDRKKACKIATEKLAELTGLSPSGHIRFGLPAYYAFGLTPKQAESHEHSGYLLLSGGDLPLALIGKLEKGVHK